MKLLALECSTARGSLALFDGDRLLGERNWATSTRGHDGLLEQLIGLLGEHHLSAANIELFAVGRGPGRYSGIRSALTTAQALGLPDQRPVYTLSAGQMLAAQAHQRWGGESYLVVGDARRGRWWAGGFLVRNGSVEVTHDYELVDPDTLASRLPEGALIVSSETSRLRALEVREAVAAERWGKEDLFPEAGTLGHLVVQRLSQGLPSEPVAPLYLHPAVEPRKS